MQTKAQTHPALGGGNGKTSSTPYLISTAAHLDTLAQYINRDGKGDSTLGKYYKLTTNISLSSYANWTPIGTSTAFKGNFDGGNYKITGLKINSTTLQYVGLFGSVLRGTIKNLGIENADIQNNRSSGNSYTGGVAGRMDSSTVSNCYVTGMVSNSNSSYSFAGGVVGLIYSGTVSNCYVTATVSASSSSSSSNVSAGGVAGGILSRGAVSNCYSTATVSSSSSSSSSIYAGGITGLTDTRGTVSNCAAFNPNIKCTGSGTKYVGRIAGKEITTADTLRNNIAFYSMLYNNASYAWSNKHADSLNGRDISAANINIADTLRKWFTVANGWTTTNGNLPGLFGNTLAMPFHLQNVTGLTAAQSYIISRHEHLALLAELVNAGDTAYNKRFYKMANNIDLSSYASWKPIGNDPTGADTNKRFKGTFDGGNYKITGLKINDTVINTGLFGYVHYGTIKNLGIENAIIVNNYSSSYSVTCVGGVVGTLSNSTVLNCYVTGTVKSNNKSSSSNSMAGGIAGRLIDNSTMSNCYSTATVSDSLSNARSFAGGVAGYVYNSAVLNCYATGAVSSSAANSSVGGVSGSIQNGSTVSNCAGLNPNINCTVSGTKFFGRVVGETSISTLTNNIAFDSILYNGAKTTWIPTGATSINGRDITAANINKADTLRKWFTTANGWTCKNDSLPGLFGKAVEIPVHLKYTPLPGVAAIGAVEYPSLDAAFAAVKDGDTVRLIDNITLLGNLYICNGKTFTLNTNNFILDFNWNGNLHIEDGSKVTLDGCDKIANAPFVYVSFYGSKDNKAVLNGNLVGVGIFSYFNAEVTVNGNISPDIYNDEGVYAANTSKIIVNGNIEARVGVTAYDSAKITVNGDIAAQIGIDIGYSPIVVVNGTINAFKYIRYYDYDADRKVELTATDYHTPHDNPGYSGYLEYKCLSSITTSTNGYVYVTDPFIPYPLTVINGSGSGNFVANTTVTIIADPAPAGMQFKEWEMLPSNLIFTDGTSIYTDTAKFTMPVKAVTARATYEIIPLYPVTVINGSGSGDYKKNDVVNITANAAPSGKVFNEWTTTESVSFANAMWDNTTFVMIPSPVTVEATYRDLMPDEHIIKMQNDGHGTAKALVASMEVLSALKGTTITLTATANSGYQFDRWEVIEGGITITNNRFTMSDYNVTIKAYFTASTGIVAGSTHALPLQVYPNPTNAQLRIENYETSMGEMVIYDVVGRVVVETHNYASLPIIDISHLENGLYFLKIGNKTIKVIKN